MVRKLLESDNSLLNTKLKKKKEATAGREEFSIRTRISHVYTMDNGDMYV